MSRPPSPHRPTVIAGLRDDQTLKAIALTCGLSIACICKWAANLGFRRMFVTDEERRAILARRRSDSSLGH